MTNTHASVGCVFPANPAPSVDDLLRSVPGPILPFDPYEVYTPPLRSRLEVLSAEYAGLRIVLDALWKVESGEQINVTLYGKGVNIARDDLLAILSTRYSELRDQIRVELYE